MKTKAFLLICLFLGFGVTQLSAQNEKNGTGSISFFDVWPLDAEWGAYIIPVWNSAGEEVDLLRGSITFHMVTNYKNGELVWVKGQYFGEVISDKDNEVFAFRDIYKWDASERFGFGHINIRGNNGSHYILNYKYDAEVGSPLLFINAQWPGDKE